MRFSAQCSHYFFAGCFGAGSRLSASFDFMIIRGPLMQEGIGPWVHCAHRHLDYLVSVDPLIRIIRADVRRRWTFPDIQ